MKGLAMEKILDKINKLLKLSESPNIEEATAAYEKAHKLLRDYNLHIEDIKEKPEIISEIVDEGKRERGWKSLLLNSIAEANYCSFITSKRRGNFLNDSYFKNTIYGREENIATTRVMYEYLCEAVERVTKDARKIDKRFNINSFKIGVVENLRERLLNVEECAALVPVSKEAKDKMIEENPNIKEVSINFSDERSIILGNLAGNKISLNKQVDTKTVVRGEIA